MAATTTRTDVTAAEGVNVGDTYTVDTPAWYFTGTVTAMQVVETVGVTDGPFPSPYGFRDVVATVSNGREEFTVNVTKNRAKAAGQFTPAGR